MRICLHALSIHTEDNLLAIEDKNVQQGKFFIMNQCVLQSSALNFPILPCLLSLGKASFLSLILSMNYIF